MGRFKGTAKHGSKGWKWLKLDFLNGQRMIFLNLIAVELADWVRQNLISWAAGIGCVSFFQYLSKTISFSQLFHLPDCFFVTSSCESQKAWPRWVARAFRLGWSHPAQRASAQVRVALSVIQCRICSLALQLVVLTDSFWLLIAVPPSKKDSQTVTSGKEDLWVQHGLRRHVQRSSFPRLIDSWQPRHSRFELLCVMLLLLEKQVAYGHVHSDISCWRIISHCQNMYENFAKRFHKSISLYLSFATMSSTASERTDLFSGFSKSISGKSACFLLGIPLQYHPI